MRPEIEQAIQLIRRKDPTSLEEALALLQNAVYSFSMKVCGQREDAEDTMQEVLLKTVPSLAKFDSPRALLVWLYKVAKNRCLLSRRHSKFAPKHALSLEELMPDRMELERLAGPPDASPESLLMRRENSKRLRAAIQELPPEYRLILVLRDMEGLSDADVAEITGLRLGTIRVRLHRARLFVRKELAKQDSLHAPRPMAFSKKTIVGEPRQRRCKELFAELSDYLDDELDDSLCGELEKHMEGCQPCQAFLASLEKSIEQCRAATNDPVDPILASKLRRELLIEYQTAMTAAGKAGKSHVSHT